MVSLIETMACRTYELVALLCIDSADKEKKRVMLLLQGILTLGWPGGYRPWQGS